MYTKPVDCTSVHKTSLLVNNEINVHGQNIKECTWTQTVTVQVYTKPVYCQVYAKTVCKLVGISLNKLKVDIWKIKFSYWQHTDNQTHLTFALLCSRAASSQLKTNLRPLFKSREKVEIGKAK